MQINKQQKDTLLDMLAFTLIDLKEIEFAVNQSMELLSSEINDQDVGIVIKDLIISLDKTKQLRNITSNLNQIITDLKHVRNSK